MSRHVSDVLQSGFLTEDERLAMDFELALEDNEDHMPEGAALALTCEKFEIEPYQYAEVLMELPDGDWWLAEKLPVRQELP